MEQEDTTAVDFVALSNAGVSVKDAFAHGRSAGLSVVSTIREMRFSYGISIAEGKELAVAHDGEFESSAAYAASLAPFIELIGYLDATEADAEDLDRRTGLLRNVRALAQAGRVDEAWAFRERLAADRFDVRPLDLFEARAVAAHSIDEAAGLVAILDEHVAEYDFGWTFPYQSTAYLESGNFTDMLGGNAPILVDRFTGAGWAIGTARPESDYVDNYRRTGNPHDSPSPPA